MKISCAILAGGQSRRFKRDKTVATLNGVTFTEILTKKLLSIFDDVMIISKDPKKFNFNYQYVTFLKELSQRYKMH
jgi:molybdopterin-guanine dinucleotide biosynthesis protein A